MHQIPVLGANNLLELETAEKKRSEEKLQISKLGKTDEKEEESDFEDMSCHQKSANAGKYAQCPQSKNTSGRGSTSNSIINNYVRKIKSWSVIGLITRNSTAVRGVAVDMKKAAVVKKRQEGMPFNKPERYGLMDEDISDEETTDL